MKDTTTGQLDIQPMQLSSLGLVITTTPRCLEQFLAYPALLQFGIKLCKRFWGKQRTVFIILKMKVMPGRLNQRGSLEEISVQLLDLFPWAPMITLVVQPDLSIF